MDLEKIMQEVQADFGMGGLADWDIDIAKLEKTNG